MFNSWYQRGSLIKSEKLIIEKALTCEFSLDETEDAILTAKQGNTGKIIIRMEE